MQDVNSEISDRYEQQIPNFKEKQAKEIEKERQKLRKAQLPKGHICTVQANRPYADAEEIEDMAAVNPVIMPYLRIILQDLVNMKKGKVLEVGCGEGHATKEVLHDLFFQIDLFDKCPLAIEKIKALRKDYPKIYRIEQNTMENFKWNSEWDCILFKYVVGYLGKD